MFRKMKMLAPNLIQDKRRLFAFIIISLAIIAALIVIPINYWINSDIFVKGITSIRGDSMLPNIKNNDIVFVQDVKFERGEIVVVESPSTTEYSGANGMSLLKRIVGLPGETVEITEDGVLINGKLLYESYTDSAKETLQETNKINEIILSDNEYFVLGDNRIISFDSRHVGAIHQTKFLYGLTTTPNEYTAKLAAMMSIFVILILAAMIVFPMMVFFILAYRSPNGPTRLDANRYVAQSTAKTLSSMPKDTKKQKPNTPKPNKKKNSKKKKR